MKNRIKHKLAQIIGCALICISVIVGFGNIVSGQEFTENIPYTPNDQVVINLSLDDILDKTNNISILEGTLLYDEAIFEKVTLEDFKVCQGFYDLEFDTNTNQFVVKSNIDQIQSRDVLTITLTVNDDIVSSNSVIGFENITGVTNAGNITATDVNNNFLVENISETENINFLKVFSIALILIVVGSLVILLWRKNIKERRQIKFMYLGLYYIAIIIAIIIFSVLKIGNIEQQNIKNENYSVFTHSIDFVLEPVVIEDESSSTVTPTSKPVISIPETQKPIITPTATPTPPTPTKTPNPPLDYNLKVSDVTTLNSKNEKAVYFDKGDDIIVTFKSTNKTIYTPTHAMINNKLYPIKSIGNDVYETSVDSLSNFGMEEIKITQLSMSNDEKLKVTDTNSTKLEILKSEPTVDGFKYEVLLSGLIRVYFNVNDQDKSIINTKVYVNDKTNNIYSNDDFTSITNYIDFTPNKNEKYNVKVQMTYDLDTNTLDNISNLYTDIAKLTEIVEDIPPVIEDPSIPVAKMELKDIININLLTADGEKIETVTGLNVSTFVPKDYLAEIIMKDLPKFYAEVEKGYIEDNKFMLTLNCEGLVSYNTDGSRKNHVDVPFGNVDGDYVSSLNFETIIEMVTNDPSVNIKLSQNLDANDISVIDNIMMNVTYTGIFDGNGYTISNLTKPLFKSLEGATIKNIGIDHANINANGIIAITATNTTMQNVHINNSSIKGIETGSFFSSTSGDTNIEQCFVSNTKVTGGKRTGGFIGKTVGNLTIKNCYMEGIVTINSDAAGGIIGQVGGTTTIENTYSDVEFNVGGNWAHGGIIGYNGNSNLSLINSISIADGKIGKRVIGSGKISVNNSYEMKESKLLSNVSSGVIEIAQNDINSDFILNTLNWDDTIWNITNTSFENMPTFIDTNNGIDVATQNNFALYETSNNSNTEKQEIYLPNKDRLVKMESFDVSKEMIYHNMFKIMPFYDAGNYVIDGNKIANDDILNTYKIETIYPLDSENNLISGLNTNSFRDISKLIITFENGDKEEYPVIFDELVGNIATYKIPSLDIGYNYNKFVLNVDNPVVKEVMEYAKNLDYTLDISTVTPENENRLYVDYYNEYVVPKLENVILNLMQSQDDYNIYSDHPVFNMKVKQNLLLNNQLEEILYTYNYLDKWYGFDVGGAKISEILFFNTSNMVNNGYIQDYLIHNTLGVEQVYRDIKKSVHFYNKVINPMTNKNITSFIEEYICIFTQYKTGEDWFANTFDGILKERGIIGAQDIVDYRAWTLMEKTTSVLLPILSAPQEDMYIVSAPTQFMIGSLNRYPQHIKGDVEGMDLLVENYANNVSKFYNTSYGFVPNAQVSLNKSVFVNYDTRRYFPLESGGNVIHESGVSQDPVIKWVYEPLGSFAGHNGSGAYANGTSVYWVEYAALTNFLSWTHETAHNQDNGYFYNRNGRRVNTWAEDHADGNITQYGNAGSYIFNLFRDYSIESNISTNMTMERINSPEKIDSYYKEMFETYYVLDYLTGQAFLQLTPQEQSNLATQASDTNSNTTYSVLSPEQFEVMNLTTMEDLWDNKIVFRNAGSAGSNQYGEDTHFNIYWYQPHIDDGRPDGYSFKKLGFELLGYAGYVDGYIGYRSGMAKNDLDALRIATKDSTSTWKSYKLDRYENVENNIVNIPYFNSDKVIELYVDALKEDAKVGGETNTNALYGMVKRVTGDFTTGTIYENNQIIEVSTAQELISGINANQTGTFKITADLDFSDIDVSSTDAYFTETFLGIVDGNGHSISGLTKPLFVNTMYAYINDLIIDKPIYTETAYSIISITSESTILENINVINSNIILPFIQTKKAGCLEFGDNFVGINKIEISTVEDLEKINEDTTAISRKSSYMLTNDIDISGINTRSSVITGDFTGIFDGNGYSLTNGVVPIFQDLNGSVKNINLSNFIINNINNNEVAALASSATNAIIENIKLDNIVIQGKHNVASLIGISTNSTIDKVTSSNIDITGKGVYIGGLIGRSFNTNVSNVIVSGEITITSTHNGGIIGAMNNGGSLVNALSNVKINRPHNTDSRSENGGLVGAFEYSKGWIENSISVSDVADDVYKVVAAKTEQNMTDIKNLTKNVYEIVETTGLSSIIPTIPSTIIESQIPILPEEGEEIKPTPETTTVPDDGEEIKPTPETTTVPDDGEVIKPTPETTTVPEEGEEIKPTPENTSVPDDGEDIKPTPETTSVPGDGEVIKPTSETTVVPEGGEDIKPSTDIDTVLEFNVGSKTFDFNSDSSLMMIPTYFNYDMSKNATYISHNIKDKELINSNENIDVNNIIAISNEMLLDKSFYINTLQWSEDIWDFSQVEFGGLPKLK